MFKTKGRSWQSRSQSPAQYYLEKQRKLCWSQKNYRFTIRRNWKIHWEEYDYLLSVSDTNQAIVLQRLNHRSLRNQPCGNAPSWPAGRHPPPCSCCYWRCCHCNMPSNPNKKIEKFSLIIIHVYPNCYSYNMFHKRNSTLLKLECQWWLHT